MTDLIEMCWLCHLKIYLGMDRVYACLQGDRVVFAHLYCAEQKGFPNPPGYYSHQEGSIHSS